MKQRWTSLIMVLVLLGSMMLIPCAATENNEIDAGSSNTENVMPSGESGSEGSFISEGDTSGSEGGSSGGSEGGSSGGSEGGSSGGSEGGNSGGSEGGSSGGTTEGGNSGGSEGGNSGGTTEGGNSGGTTEGGNSGGTTEGGNSGGTTEGGNSGGTTEGGNSGGITEGGSSGDTEGGNTGGNEGGNGDNTEGDDGSEEEDPTDAPTEAPTVPPTEETTDNKKPSYESIQKKYNTCQHEYPEWTAKTWSHVRNCKKCLAYQSKPHVYTNRYVEDPEKDRHWLVCDDCGYQKTSSKHELGDTLQSDETGHWYSCTLCDAKQSVEAHIPGPGANESRDQICTACEYIMVPRGTVMDAPTMPTETTVPVEETVPEVVSWEYNDLTHWQDNGNGEKQNQSMHKWDAGTKQPDDSMIYMCTVCSAMMVDDGSETENAFLQGALAAGFVIVMVALAGIVFMILIKSKNPGRYSGRKNRR